ncbi:MAG TPA: glycosyltransferase family 4 protein [Candidatus Binataceae bacterium]|nr:glycosyltransferase family 4 protein [Candidatus Binataceae bacterium]
MREEASLVGKPLKKLRIAQVAPLYESVPPKLYGGTERVISYLTEELVRRGHEVTLCASGDSLTSARLVPGFEQALRLRRLEHLGHLYQLPMLSWVFERAEQFDVIHSHVDFWALPYAGLVKTPTLSTLHASLDQPEAHIIYRRYRDAPLVSVSNAQRRPLPDLNWLGTAYHGLPRQLLKYSPHAGKYLAFLGRIAPEKRPDLAIEIARLSGLPLKLAAKVDNSTLDYFEAVIKPRLSPPDIELIGEIGESEKSAFLGGACALLFPINWPEPFGLVIAEALACGTPVIARPCGSVPELIRHGTTGWIASTLKELTDAVAALDRLDRAQCRREFEQRFSVEAMADSYERLYHIAMVGQMARPPALGSGVAPGALATPK